MVENNGILRYESKQMNANRKKSKPPEPIPAVEPPIPPIAKSKGNPVESKKAEARGKVPETEAEPKPRRGGRRKDSILDESKI